jgi:hypothetical protein
MVYTYSKDYETEMLPWPTWVARITNIRNRKRTEGDEEAISLTVAFPVAKTEILS